MNHADLVSALTQLDMRESKRKGYNHYALGHYLHAAQQCTDDIAGGMSELKAFARHFNPTASMNRVARELGLKLDVERGRWIALQPA